VVKLKLGQQVIASDDLDFAFTLVVEIQMDPSQLFVCMGLSNGPSQNEGNRQGMFS
jgi:hypothetical protein